MTQIVVDPLMREKLRDAIDGIEFVDQNGKVLGTFCALLQPPYDPQWIPPMDEAEMERRANEPGVYTTEEVLQHLRSL